MQRLLQELHIERDFNPVIPAPAHDLYFFFNDPGLEQLQHIVYELRQLAKRALRRERMQIREQRMRPALQSIRGADDPGQAFAQFGG